MILSRRDDALAPSTQGGIKNLVILNRKLRHLIADQLLFDEDHLTTLP